MPGRADVRVNPTSVRDYADRVQGIVNDIPVELEALLSDVVNVNYSGENAVEFKTKCANLAMDLSRSINRDLERIVEAVSEAIKAIARSLGSRVPTLSVSSRSVSQPAIPQGDGTLNVDYRGLEELAQQVERRSETIKGLLDEQSAKLRKTDWDGGSKDRAVSAVSRYTRSANSELERVSRELRNFIQDQIAAVKAAD